MHKSLSWVQENIERLQTVGVDSTALTLRGPDWLNNNAEWLYQGIELLFKALSDCSTIWMALPTRGLSPDFTGRSVLTLPTLRTLLTGSTVGCVGWKNVARTTVAWTNVNLIFGSVLDVPWMLPNRASH